MRRFVFRPSLVILGLLLAVATTSANHSWGSYHWARTSNPFTIKLGDNVTAAWDAHLAVASADWSASSVLDTVVVGGGTSPRSCRPTAGRVEVCNAKYGNTGWLGIAQIWITGGTHITQGAVKNNDTYFNTPTYNSPEWRQFVMCQEIGHTFGLDHQDENFSNPNLGTCMDYTNSPASNQHPNQHDYDQLAAIYAHLDSTTTIASAPGGSSGAAPDAPSEWGQLMKSSHGGRLQRFERDLGNGQKVVTFVIWA